jgi:protein-tyrosine-phosphatase/catechol 2,3-dioxygenase-like lactoylglutathione lyase family enzyme
MADNPSVLFVCVHNAGRSQMAAALLTHLAGDRIDVRSAGTEPADEINPAAVAVMAELGIDITAHAPKILTAEAVHSSDVVITMGCGDKCPYFPGVAYRDWDLPDPAGQPLDAVRAVRDDIAEHVRGLITELTTGTKTPEPSAERNPAMSRVQLALNVDDLDKAITFYAALFNTEPAKVKPGYANFVIAEPPLKLVLLENPGHGGTLNHLGVEVTSSDAVRDEITRLNEAGLFTDEEIDTTCCFATQDKVWVTGPGGERWEIYTVKADSDTFGPTTDQPDQTCCTA